MRASTGQVEFESMFNPTKVIKVDFEHVREIAPEYQDMSYAKAKNLINFDDCEWVPQITYVRILTKDVTPLDVELAKDLIKEQLTVSPQEVEFV